MTRVNPQPRAGLVSIAIALAIASAILITNGTPLDLAAGIVGVLFFGGGAALLWRARRQPRWAPKRAVAPSPNTEIETAPARMWFVLEDPFDDDDGSPLTDHETGFLGELAERAATWPAAGASSFAARFDATPTLMACVSVRHATELFVVGVHVTGEAVRGGPLHNQLYDPTEAKGSLALPTAEASDIEGVAAWFESCLRRPVERWEWWHKGFPYAVRYQFADTKEGLVEAYRRDNAPRGQHARLVAAGSFRGRQWIRTAGIGAPDVVHPIRIDGAVQPAPALPPYLWYQCPLETP